MFAKQMLNASFELSLTEAVDREAQSQTVCLSSNDAREGMRSFLEKRPAEFEGR